MNINVVLTQEEIQNLYQLLDMAVKAGGVQVAQAALVIISKLQSGIDETAREAEAEAVVTAEEEKTNKKS